MLNIFVIIVNNVIENRWAVYKFRNIVVVLSITQTKLNDMCSLNFQS